jgi:alpha-2-macroglobulin
MLGNISMVRLINEQGIDDSALKTELSAAIDEDLGRLKRSQTIDGGWSWLTGQASEPYISSYVLFGLVQASNAGFVVEENVKTNAQNYLVNSLFPPETVSLPWQLDRLVFQHFSLAYSGMLHSNPSVLSGYTNQLSIWSKALLALTFELETPGNQDSQDLISEIQGLVSPSSTGAHWQDVSPSPMNMVTPNFTTAIVAYTLAHFDPQSTQLSEAIRYLVYNRRASGGWASSYESAWILLAMTEMLKENHELQASFDYDATLNQVPFANGSAVENVLSSVAAEEPLNELLSDAPNALNINHGAGDGNLYYRAYLQVFKPVETITPAQRGLTITRRYELLSADCIRENCQSVSSLQLVQLQPPVKVHLSITVPEDTYYLAVEDYIPAGSEIVNVQLNTTQLGTDIQTSIQDPFAEGWNSWVFSSPTIYDDHIAWVASFVPAGSYELTYRIQPTQAGEYRVLPAHVYQIYFPEVEGASGGSIFTISR